MKGCVKAPATSFKIKLHLTLFKFVAKLTHSLAAHRLNTQIRVLRLTVAFLQTGVFFLQLFNEKKGNSSAVTHQAYGLHFPSTPDKDAFSTTPVYLYIFVWGLYLLCVCLTQLSKRLTLCWLKDTFWWMLKKKKKGEEEARDRVQIVPWCCGHWDAWMYATPRPLLATPVLYVLFLIPGCTSGKRPPSAPQYVPQWHFTRVLVQSGCFPRDEWTFVFYR